MTGIRKTVWTLGMAALAVVMAMAVGRSATNNAVPAQNPAAESAVKIDNFVFSPNTLTISAGSTVRWTNRDDIPHTVVSDDKSFKSKALDTDDTFTFTFSKPGTYTYFCSLHPKMTGKIVVQ
ncbi:MAG TPA: cupredoxin family copper-binding protein [Candidatus Angelobacter sp.]|nr:cupredoxin family copper-binding protein [Candidatus Angelobacter sp.]